MPRKYSLFKSIETSEPVTREENRKYQATTIQVMAVHKNNSVGKRMDPRKTTLTTGWCCEEFDGVNDGVPVIVSEAEGEGEKERENEEDIGSRR